MISNPCIEVQTSPVDRLSVPEWFAEVVMITRRLATQGLLEAFGQQVRLVRGHFGSYESIDFLGPLIGYAISGERTLASFFERVAPFESAFMALFGRASLPHRSSLSRFLADVDRPCLEAFRALFEQHGFAEGWTSETVGGIFDRQGRYIVFDVDATQSGLHGSEPCPVLLNCLLLDGDSTRSVRLVTKGVSAERWYVHAPRHFKCTLVNGSAPTQARAMVTIAGNSPRHYKPSQPI